MWPIFIPDTAISILLNINTFNLQDNPVRRKWKEEERTVNMMEDSSLIKSSFNPHHLQEVGSRLDYLYFMDEETDLSFCPMLFHW